MPDPTNAFRADVKYALRISIALPRERVAELFGDPQTWQHWQMSLVDYEPMSGKPGEPGSKTRLLHRFGRRCVEMIESVESSNLPEELVCVYEAPGAWNRVAHRFHELTPTETDWEFDTEFRCTGPLRLLAWLAPGVFRKASLRDMQAFKRFAEATA